MAEGAADGGVVFQEAIDFLREQLEIGPEAWAELLGNADAIAAGRAGAMDEALHRDIVEAVIAALEAGTGLDGFLAEWAAIVERHGWAEGGERGELAFRTIAAEAWAAGRWNQIVALKHIRPWLRYVTAGDHRVRPAHADWHGTVLHVDDPWWDTHFPPNGWNCRCYPQSLSDRELARYGYAPSPQAPQDGTEIRFVKGQPVEVPKGIDPGFAYNPGKVWGATL